MMLNILTTAYISASVKHICRLEILDLLIRFGNFEVKFVVEKAKDYFGGGIK